MSNPELPRAEWQVWPALSKANAARVIKLVNPKPGHHDHCLREAEESVEWIKRKTAATKSPGQRKKALERAAEKLQAAIKSIEALPIATQYEIDPKMPRRTIKATDTLFPEFGEVVIQPGTLHQLHDRTVALATKITVKRHTGGKKTGQGNLIDAAKKRAAADCAESMIKTWGSKPLTLANYRKLTALLFKLATDGKVGDVERVCRARLSAPGKATSRRFEMLEMSSNPDAKVFEDND